MGCVGAELQVEFNLNQKGKLLFRLIKKKEFTLN